MSPSVPYRDIPGRISKILADHGAETSDLYSALANSPSILETWIGMAWGLRADLDTERELREIMILRSAHRHSATYQWADHVVMARNAGVPDAKIQSIASWEDSDWFSRRERVALALMDEMIAASVTDETLADLAQEFDAGERVKLIVTAGFSCMVPRVLDALRLEA